MRHSLGFLAALQDEVDESEEDPNLVLEGLVDSGASTQGVVTSDWQQQRRIGRSLLEPDLKFVDITAGETLQYLRRVLATAALKSGVSDVDMSAVSGSLRQFTQECSRYIFDQTDDQGAPLYAGIRYVSRLNPNWECWAIFDSRFRHQPYPAESVYPNDPGLVEAARLFNLSIEGQRRGEYIRP